MRAKSETLQRFRTLKQQVENETGLRIGSLRTDRGGEFMPQQFQQFCEEHGIKRQ